MAISANPSSGAGNFLRDCENDPRYQNDDYLRRRITVALDFRPKELQDYKLRQAAWKKRAEILAAANGTLENPPAAPEPVPEPLATTPAKPPPATSAPAMAQPPSLSVSTAAIIGLCLLAAGGLYFALRRR